MTPAKAFIGVDIGGVGIGLGGPYYSYFGYYPSPVYGYAPVYYRHYVYYGASRYSWDGY